MIPDPEQMLACIRVCQTLSNFYTDIHLFRYDEKREEIYILAGDTIGITIFKNGLWKMMTQKPNFNQMNRKELRNYVLTHRQDEEALRIYMERLHSEPGIDRYTGGLNGQDFSQLEQLLEKKCDTL